MFHQEHTNPVEYCQIPRSCIRSHFDRLEGPENKKYPIFSDCKSQSTFKTCKFENFELSEFLKIWNGHFRRMALHTAIFHDFVNFIHELRSVSFYSNLGVIGSNEIALTSLIEKSKKFWGHIRNLWWQNWIKMKHQFCHII